MRNRRDYYAEDVEFLRQGGCGDVEILRSLNVNAGQLMRALYRAGRADLARPFAAMEKRQRGAA